MTPITLPADLLERFEILSRLGEGGMGTVFLARQRSLERLVAIKVLKILEPLERERFRREARVLSLLSHPNILQIYEASIGDGETPYIITELLEGEDLRASLDGGMDVARMLGILEALASALDHAHGMGVVHRDVKPENVMLPEDRVKLCDFGLARSPRVGETLTQDGTFFGTPLYVAPETVQGLETTPASDQFSLAVLAFEMLAGRPPFAGTSPLEVVAARMRPPYRPPSSFRPELPRALDSVLLTAMSFDPASRFASCQLFVEQLRAALAARLLGRTETRLVTHPGPASAEPSSHETTSKLPAVPPPRPARAVILVTSLALVAALGLATRRSSRPPSPPPSVPPAPVILHDPTQEEIATIVPPIDPALGELLSRQVNDEAPTGKSMVVRTRALLSPPLVEGIEGRLDALSRLSSLLAKYPGSWEWLAHSDDIEVQFRSLIGPLVESINLGKLAWAVHHEWAGPHEEVRQRQVQILKHLEKSLIGVRGDGSPASVVRDRMLVEVRYALDRTASSLGDLVPRSVQAILDTRTSQPERIQYLSGLVDCSARAGTLAPPLDRHTLVYQFRLITLVRALVNADILLRDARQSAADLERLRRAYRHLAQLVDTELRALPPESLQMFEGHCVEAARFLARGLHLLAPLTGAQTGELLSALVELVDLYPVAMMQLTSRIRPTDLQHLEQALVEHPELVPAGSRLRAIFPSK